VTRGGVGTTTQANNAALVSELATVKQRMRTAEMHTTEHQDVLHERDATIAHLEASLRCVSSCATSRGDTAAVHT
jgi:hypothetical protein